MTSQNRVSKGVPAGGQFAAGAKADSGDLPVETQDDRPTMEKDGFEMRDLGTVVIGGTTFRVEEQRFANIPETWVWLHGPRKGDYFLRPCLTRKGEDYGLRQVVSFKSGQPLRQHGNEVRVYHLGDVIEQAPWKSPWS